MIKLMKEVSFMGQNEIMKIFLMIMTTFVFVVCLVPFIKK